MWFWYLSHRDCTNVKVILWCCVIKCYDDCVVKWFRAVNLQVNIVPIIAKADTIAKSELKQFKDKVCKILLCLCLMLKWILFGEILNVICLLTSVSWIIALIIKIRGKEKLIKNQTTVWVVWNHFNLNCLLWSATLKRYIVPVSKAIHFKKQCGKTRKFQTLKIQAWRGFELWPLRHSYSTQPGKVSGPVGFYM